MVSHSYLLFLYCVLEQAYIIQQSCCFNHRFVKSLNLVYLFIFYSHFKRSRERKKKKKTLQFNEKFGKNRQQKFRNILRTKAISNLHFRKNCNFIKYKKILQKIEHQSRRKKRENYQV